MLFIFSFSFLHIFDFLILITFMLNYDDNKSYIDITRYFIVKNCLVLCLVFYKFLRYFMSSLYDFRY